MKNLIIKIPTFIFTSIILLPLFFVAYGILSEEFIVEMGVLKTLFWISSIVKVIWLFSIVDYFQSKLEDFKYLKLIYFLLLIDGLLTFSAFFIADGPGLLAETALYLLPIGIHIATTVFITLLVRKVFYNRAVWFIVIEIFTLVVGIITLTPEIKRNEKELDA